MAHTDRWRRVSEKAFELYLSRGGGDGRHIEDWLEAERLVAAEVAAEDEHSAAPSTAARNTPEERAAANGTTPESRDAESQVPRGRRRRRTKTATL